MNVDWWCGTRNQQYLGFVYSAWQISHMFSYCITIFHYFKVKVHFVTFYHGAAVLLNTSGNSSILHASVSPLLTPLCLLPEPSQHEMNYVKFVDWLCETILHINKRVFVQVSCTSMLWVRRGHIYTSCTPVHGRLVVNQNHDMTGRFHVWSSWQ